MPPILRSWKQNIYETSLKYNNLREKNIKRRLNILNLIENTRKKNNINWMNIVRTSFINSPKNTKIILKKITSDDKKITGQKEKLSFRALPISLTFVYPSQLISLLLGNQSI